MSWRSGERRIDPIRTARADARLVQNTLVFLALHAVLGFAVKASPWIATAHALVTCFAAFVTVVESRTMDRVLPVLAYVAVSESLWRVGQAMIFYETAKYALAGLAVLAAMRWSRAKRSSTMALVYFALLCPSILVMPEFDRQDVSFNLSGPFALAVATFFLSRLPLSELVLRRTLTALMGPAVALATVATFSTLTTENIDFYSSKVASGGLGQNQASSLLGLGALVAFLYLTLLPRRRPLSAFIGLLGVWCAGQAALTFSRGGLATTVGAVAAATFFLSSDRRFRGSVALRIALVLAVALAFVVPVLESITGGQITERFTSSSLTGRDRIIEADLLTFRENPVLGVGPGQSYEEHARTFRSSSAHTEYSRLLAEHGSFGLAALILILALGLRSIRRQTTIRGRALSAALVAWSLLYMFHAAMRMAVVSFLFALASAYLFDDPPVRRRRQHAIGVGQHPQA